MKFLKKILNKQDQKPKVDLEKRFKLIGRVGQGSMSKVWRAHDQAVGKQVALKILDVEKTKKLEQRFVGLNRPTEGEIAVGLSHRNIVRTQEHGVSTKGEQFLVMDFVDGVSLGYLVDMQNSTMKEHRLRFMLEFGDSIYYLHKQGWIHRDICPRNVLLDTSYTIKLIDFGLAVPNTEPFRKPGNRTGTVSYMAPELIKRQPTDLRIDVFSFAASCYEMYTQKLPWDHSGVSLEAMLQHINRSPADIRTLEPSVDDSIAEIIMKGLALYPNDRWRSMGEMLVALREACMLIQGKADENYAFFMDEKQKRLDIERGVVRGAGAGEKTEDEKFKELMARPLVKAGRKQDDDYEDVSDLVDDEDDEYEDVSSTVGSDGDDELDLDHYFAAEDSTKKPPAKKPIAKSDVDDDDDEYEEV